jgi:hypothetical protein
MKEVVNQESIQEGKLNEIPDFYRSLTKNMTLSRLKNLSVKTNMPFVTEFISGQVTLTTLTLRFQQKYKQIPLVLGLIRRSDLGQRVTIPIQPDNTWMFVEKSQVVIGKVGGNELQSGDIVKLRVYSLDLYNE